MANQQGKETQLENVGGTGSADADRTDDGSILGLSPNDPEIDRSKSERVRPPSSMAGASSSRNTGAADQPISEKVSSAASGILDKAKETASGTYDAVATEATTKIEERKGELSTGLKTLAATFRRTGNDLEGTPQSTPLTGLTARYTGAAASQIEKVADYFERKNLRAMMRDAEDFARRNPAIFLGAAFGLGLVAARFLKSSPPSANESVGAQNPNTGLPSALPASSDRPNPMPTNP